MSSETICRLRQIVVSLFSILEKMRTFHKNDPSGVKSTLLLFFLNTMIKISFPHDPKSTFLHFKDNYQFP